VAISRFVEWFAAVVAWFFIRNGIYLSDFSSMTELDE